MRQYRGRITEIRLDPQGRHAAWVECASGAIPAAGQYVRAHNLDDREAALGSWLFPGNIADGGFLALPPIPPSWTLGTQLDLWGPLGKGFVLPGGVQRLALAAIGDTATRLLPLIEVGMQHDCSVTLFTDVPLNQLSLSVEVHPLSALPGALDWPQFLALDVPRECLSTLRVALGLEGAQGLPCPTQVLVYAPMPCTGMAECGVCAIPARRGRKLVCKHGPVFDLDQLEW